MLAVEKWAEDKNPFLALFAIKAAYMAEEAFHLLRGAREKSILVGEIVVPPLPLWLSYYHQTKRIFFLSQGNNSDPLENILINAFCITDDDLKGYCLVSGIAAQQEASSS